MSDAEVAPSLEALSYPLTAAAAAARLRREGVAHSCLVAAMHRDASRGRAALARCWPGNDDGAEVRIQVAGASRLAEQRIYESTSAGRVLAAAFPAAARVLVLLVGREVDPAGNYDPASVASAGAPGGVLRHGLLWRPAGWRASGLGPAYWKELHSGAVPVSVSVVRSSVEEALASPEGSGLGSFLNGPGGPGKDGAPSPAAPSPAAPSPAAPSPAPEAQTAEPVVRLGVCHHAGFGNRWEGVRRGWGAGLLALLSWGHPVVFSCANGPEARRGELPLMIDTLRARVLGGGLCRSCGVYSVIGSADAEMRRLGLTRRQDIVAASLDSSSANYFAYAVQGFRPPPGSAAAAAPGMPAPLAESPASAASTASVSSIAASPGPAPTEGTAADSTAAVAAWDAADAWLRGQAGRVALREGLGWLCNTTNEVALPFEVGPTALSFPAAAGKSAFLSAVGEQSPARGLLVCEGLLAVIDRSTWEAVLQSKLCSSLAALQVLSDVDTARGWLAEQAAGSSGRSDAAAARAGAVPAWSDASSLTACARVALVEAVKAPGPRLAGVLRALAAHETAEGLR